MGLRIDYCNDADEKILSCETIEHVPRWKTRNLTEGVMRQLTQGSRVLADIVGRLHDEHFQKGVNDGGVPNSRPFELARDVLLNEKMRSFEALFTAPWLVPQIPIFDGNRALAALHKGPPSSWLWRYLGQLANQRLWTECWSVIKSLPDFFIHCDLNLRRFRDLVLYELAFLLSHNGKGTIFFYYSISIVHRY